MMGQFHSYRKLQEVARKEVTFKQTMLAQVAEQQGLLEREYFTVAGGGVCAALAMMWVADKVVPGRTMALRQRFRFSHADPDPTTKEMYRERKGREIAQHVKAIPEAAELQQLYNSTEPEEKAVGLMAQKVGLKVVTNLDNLGELKAGEVLWGGYDVVVPKATEESDATEAKPAGHAFGLFRNDLNDRYFFFDANTGEYSFTTDSLGSFWKAYGQVLTEELKWKVSNIVAYLLARK